MELSRFHKVSQIANLAWTWGSEGVTPAPVFMAVNGGWPAFVWTDVNGNVTGTVYFDGFGNPQISGSPPVTLPTGAPVLKNEIQLS